MTTLIDAAVKPTVAAYVSGIARRLATLGGGRRIPFSIMRSNGGVLSADEVVNQPISTVLSGPAAGALGAAVIAANAGFPSVLTCDGGGTSTDVTVIADGAADADHRGVGRPVPGQDPDDRRGHRRRRRRFGGLDLGGGHAQGGSTVGRRGSRAGLLPAGRHRTHRHRRASGARPDPGPPARRRDRPGHRGRDRRRSRRWPTGSADDGGLRRRHSGDLGLEPGQRAAPDHHQTGARRPRLPDGHVRRIRIAAGLPADGHPRHPGRSRAAQPRQRLRLRSADGRRAERLRADGRRARPGTEPGIPRRRCTTS